MALLAQCSCKGVRACILCEVYRGRVPGQRLNVSAIRRTFVFCPRCCLCFEVNSESGELLKGVIRVPGIQVAEEAISERQEEFLQENVERSPWIESQSGRRKQDFGPKVNFKKQRVKTDAFQGFPSYMDIVMGSFSSLPEESMRDFNPIELCNLKYSPERGSCIDPHFDDFWLWGERLVTLNLQGATVLTFSRAQDFSDLTQTNISSVTELTKNNENYALTTDNICRLSRTHSCAGLEQLGATECVRKKDKKENITNDEVRAKAGDVVHVALPRRSVVLVADEARFQWHHSVLREHVSETRLAMTVRELSEAFRDPTREYEFSLGRELTAKAKINPAL